MLTHRIHAAVARSSDAYGMLTHCVLLEETFLKEM